MMRRRRFLGVLLAGAMAVSLLSGCGEQGAAAETPEKGNGTQNSAQDSGGSGAAADADGISIAANTWGSGAYPLDIIVHADERVAKAAGINLDVADNQFTADKVISDLQSQLANNPDGVLMMSVVDAVFGNVQQLCDAKGVPYVLDTGLPSDESVFESMKNDKLFIGAATATQYESGANLARAAAAAGNKTAVILAAAMGDYSHDQRIAGFTAAFEETGGQVRQVMHCSDPSEATTKANDLMTANADVDCVYTTGGDYLSAMAAIKSSDPTAEYELYGTDVAPDLIDYIQQGVIQAMNGGGHVCGAISMCLMINYLDGHQILDADGKAPIFDDLNLYMITAENAAGFKKLHETESCFVTDEEFKSLLYRFNPEVSYETFDAFVKNYADLMCERAKAQQ